MILVFMEEKKMSKKLVNKHIVRAISLGLTAVMASTPVTALASEANTETIEPPVSPADTIQNQSEFAQAAEEVKAQIQEAQDSAMSQANVMVDDTKEEEIVVLPSTGNEILETPSVMNATANTDLTGETATVDYNGTDYEVGYKAGEGYNGLLNVQQNTGEAVVYLTDAENGLDVAVDLEEAAIAKTEVAETQVEKAETAVNDVIAANQQVEEAESKLEEATKVAEAATTKAEAEAAIWQAETAVNDVMEAEEKAKAAMDTAKLELTAAQTELDAAKTLYETAKTTMNASKDDVAKAYTQMVAAEEKAEALKAEADKTAEDYEKASELKKLYEEMKAVAAKDNLNSDYFSAEEKEDFTDNFGTEKASSAYWTASLNYFKAYIKYAYGIEEGEWIYANDNWARDNKYVVTYTTSTGETVTRSFNYHVENKEGDISIYEKEESVVYGGGQYQAKESDVVVGTEDKKFVIKTDDSELVDEITYETGANFEEKDCSVKYEVTEIDVADKDGDKERVVPFNSPYYGEQLLKKLLEKLNSSDALFAELTCNYSGVGPVVITVNKNDTVEDLKAKVYEGDNKVLLGEIGIEVKEKYKTEYAIKETKTVTAEGKEIVLSEKVYTASTYDSMATVVKERKDTSQDEKVREAREKASADAVANYREKQDAAAIALAAVKEARADFEKAKKSLEALNVNDENYQNALARYNKAKTAYDEAQNDLATIKSEVKDALDNYNQVKEEVEDKFAEVPGTEPNPTGTQGNSAEQTTVNPNVQTQQDEIQTQEVEPTMQVGTGQQTVVNGQAADAEVQETQLVAIAEEEVPLADGNQGVVDDEEDSTLTIEEEEVPLAAAPVAKEKMSWWWLLIVALIGATGYEMYKKHQEKKELENQ